jgi:hypothetical protein
MITFDGEAAGCYSLCIMTYRERLEQLLLDSIQKSEHYISAGNVPPEMAASSQTVNPDNDYNDWECAEDDYIAFLDFIKMNQIRPGDTMPG